MPVGATPSGQLLYIIGASGAGKDSLLRFVATHVDADRVSIARRYITRPEDAGGEHHIAVDQSAYARLLAEGRFAMHWSGNGHHYGIDSEIDLWLEKRRVVLVNGSRKYLDEASRRYPDLWPVLIRVSEDVLRRRLLNRGREPAIDIEQRIARARELATINHPRLRMIDNNGPLEQAGNALLALISRTKPRYAP